MCAVIKNLFPPHKIVLLDPKILKYQNPWNIHCQTIWTLPQVLIFRNFWTPQYKYCNHLVKNIGHLKLVHVFQFTVKSLLHQVYTQAANLVQAKPHDSVCNWYGIKFTEVMQTVDSVLLLSMIEASLSKQHIHLQKFPTIISHECNNVFVVLILFGNKLCFSLIANTIARWQQQFNLPFMIQQSTQFMC